MSRRTFDVSQGKAKCICLGYVHTAPGTEPPRPADCTVLTTAAVLPLFNFLHFCCSHCSRQSSCKALSRCAAATYMWETYLINTSLLDYEPTRYTPDSKMTSYNSINPTKGSTSTVVHSSAAARPSAGSMSPASSKGRREGGPLPLLRVLTGSSNATTTRKVSFKSFKPFKSLISNTFGDNSYHFHPNFTIAVANERQQHSATPLKSFPWLHSLRRVPAVNPSSLLPSR